METITLEGITQRILTVQFSGRLSPWEVPAFRGAIGRKVGPDAVLFHQHEGEKLRFAYPLIQYKQMNGKPTIICIGEGVDEIHRFFAKADWSITIGHKHLPMRIERLSLDTVEMGLSATPIRYRLSHWAALNQRNHQEYQRLEGIVAKTKYLEQKLTGNILSFAKGIGWHIDQPIEVTILDMTEAPRVTIKGIPLVNFNLTFSCNVMLPSLIGLGGKVSVGMGVVGKEEK